MIKADKYYIENLNRIKNEGTFDENPRPKWSDGRPANSLFITQVFEEYDLSKNEFPITTLRNTAVKTGIKEIFWIYQKQTSCLKEARKLGIDWWEEWNIGDDTIGQRYGATIRRYDLVNKLLNGLISDKYSRRHIIDMYQYSDLEETQGLNPCAYSTSWSVRKVNKEYYLDMTLNQRSSDYIVANYINKVQYVALQMMVASHCGFRLGKFCHLVQNLHIYDRHLEFVDEILNRSPLMNQPIIELKLNKKFYEIEIGDFYFKGLEGIKKLSKKLELAI